MNVLQGPRLTQSSERAVWREGTALQTAWIDIACKTSGFEASFIFKPFASAHRGKVWAANRAEGGAKFTVDLPAIWATRPLPPMASQWALPLAAQKAQRAGHP
jgi:hypothetical protein